MNPLPDRPGYLADRFGNIWSQIRRGPRSGSLRKLKPKRDRHGYLFVGLCIGGVVRQEQIHRLILMAFVGPPLPGQQSCHANGIRNDNRLENLRWGTPRENQADRKIHGTSPEGENNGQATISEATALAIIEMGARGVKCAEIARQFRLSYWLVWGVVRGKSWKHLPRPDGAKVKREAFDLAVQMATN